jgi:hypothetical protein
MNAAPTAWERVESILRENYNEPDIEAAKIFYSVVAAHCITEYPPCWLLGIAPSGSMKTDLIESLRGLPRIHFADEVTANTFLSGKLDEGKVREHSPSLLHRIGTDGILAVADFSTFACQDPRRLATVLSQLRRIYDGDYSREFGTEENLADRTWEGRLTFLAGATPDIDAHYKIFQLMGERFARLRMPRAGGVKTGVKALLPRKTLKLQLRAAVKGLLKPILDLTESPAVDISPEMIERIAAMTEIVTRARTYIVRDRSSREMESEPAPEGNTRLPQEIAQIGRGWALLNGRQSVGEEEFQLTHRVALDSMPPIRKQVLAAVETGKSAYSTCLPKGVISRAVEDLRAVGLIEGIGFVQEDPLKYVLSEEAKQLIYQAVGSSLFFTFERKERGGVAKVLAGCDICGNY